MGKVDHIKASYLFLDVIIATDSGSSLPVRRSCGENFQSAGRHDNSGLRVRIQFGKLLEWLSAAGDDAKLSINSDK